jgi:hypothetical protein
MLPTLIFKYFDFLEAIAALLLQKLENRVLVG